MYPVLVLILGTSLLMVRPRCQFMLYTVVAKAPTCVAARGALDTLKVACELFEAAARFGGRSVALLVSSFCLV